MIKNVAISIETEHGTLLLSMPRPARHKDIIEAMNEQFTGTRTQRSIMQAEEGFLDDKGAFMNRKQALEYAVNHGQAMRRKLVVPGELHSEDLW